MPAQPFEKVLSDSTRVLFGWKDAHAEIKVKPPVGPEVTVPVSPDQVERVKKLFDEAYLWAMKPEEERKAGVGAREVELEARARGRWEFPDGHIELRIRPIRLSPWIPIKIDQVELVAGKPVMDEVYAWKCLPEEVRTLQGV
jgi:hypothetical protein